MKFFTSVLFSFFYIQSSEALCRLEKNIRDGSFVEIKIGQNVLIDVESYKEFDDNLFFATGPIFGKPEIGVIDCITGKRITIVKAKNISKAYPNGADYFRLKFVKKIKNEFLIKYYYGFDVDKLDFKKLEITQNSRTSIYRKKSERINLAALKRK